MADETPVVPDPQMDGFLRMLIQHVTGSDGAFPVVLSSGGFLIAGELVSGHKYFEGLADSFAAAGSDNPAVVSFVDDLRYLGKKMVEVKDTGQPPYYVHLRNATIGTTAGPNFAAKGTWWRVKVAAVDGFTLGTLTKG